MVEICELKKEDEKAWDEYVFNNPSSTFYHQIEWKNVVEKTYGHKPYYLIAKENEKICAVLPLFFMKSIFFGKKLISLPFSPYGGAIGDNSIFEKMLIDRAIKITENTGAEYMELRNNVPKNLKLVSNSLYVTLILKLNNSPEVVWDGLNNKVRNAIRNSLKLPLEISNGCIDDFYKLYSKNMRELGTPTHSKEFFNTVISEFKDKAEIITVQYKDESISSAILFYFKDTVISGWAASDRKYRSFNSNNLLYWSAIKSACEEGYQFFDFGRSLHGSGTYRFKKPWGAEEHQLHYLYYLNGIKKIPDISQANHERQRFARVWKILPLSLTNTIGAKLRGNIP